MRAHLGQCFSLLVLLMIASFTFTFIIYFESLQTLKRWTLSVLSSQMIHVSNILPWVSSSVQIKQDVKNLLTEDLLPQQANLNNKATSLIEENPTKARATKKKEIPNLDLINNSSRASDKMNSVISKQANGLLVFGQPMGCEPLDPQILLFNRVFKTGSTTTSYLMNNMGYLMNYSFYAASTEDWYETGKSYPYPGIVPMVATRQLGRFPRMAFAAHFYFRKDFQLQNTHTYINQVRHPIKRFVSHYFYLHLSKDRPRKRIQELIESGQINETIEECFQNQRTGCKNNVMTRFFCGPDDYCKTGSRKALQKAMYNIKMYYASVGLLEHFDLYLQILHKRLPHFIKDVTSTSVTQLKITPRYKVSTVSRTTIRRITEANWADIKLYQFIQAMFWKQIRVCGLN